VFRRKGFWFRGLWRKPGQRFAVCGGNAGSRGAGGRKMSEGGIPEAWVRNGTLCCTQDVVSCGASWLFFFSSTEDLSASSPTPSPTCPHLGKVASAKAGCGRSGNQTGTPLVSPPRCEPMEGFYMSANIIRLLPDEERAVEVPTDAVPDRLQKSYHRMKKPTNKI